MARIEWTEGKERKEGELEANVAKEAIGHTCGTITVESSFPDFACEPKNVTAESATPFHTSQQFGRANFSP